jgi:Flp pilus assembly protein TadD
VVLYTRTLVQSPDAYHIRNNLGTVYWKQGKVEAAEREWLTAHRLAPRNAIILNNLGLVRAKEKRYEEAVEYFRRAMHLQPNYTDPHLNLGEVLAAMGRKEEAKLQLRAAVALSPLNVSARNLLGKLYLDAGSFAEAEEQFRRSVQSKPTSDGYYGLGLLHVRRQEYGQAEEAFRQAAWLDRFDSRVRFRLGTIYKSSGRTAEALREFQAGLETDPSNPEALAALEELGRRQQDETRTKD